MFGQLRACQAIGPCKRPSALGGRKITSTADPNIFLYNDAMFSLVLHEKLKGI